MRRWTRLALSPVLFCLIACGLQPAWSGIQIFEDEKSANPTLHLLAVGIDQYANPAFHLTGCVADATAVATTMKTSLHSSYKDIDITLLTNKDATLKGLRDAIEKEVSACEPNDTFVFFYAGTGGHPSEKGEFTLITTECKDVASTTEGQLSTSQLGASLSRIAAKNQLIILDSCHSADSVDLLKSALVRHIDTAGLGRNLAVLAVEGEAQEQNGHGVLTSFILRGLSGKADMMGDGSITCRELLSFAELAAAKSPPELSGSVENVVQFAYGHDFPLARNPVYNCEPRESSKRDEKQTPMQMKEISTDNIVLPTTAINSARHDYALFIANQNYMDKKLNGSRNPIDDVRELSSVLRNFYGWDTEVFENKTLDQIQDKLKEYATRKYGPEDQVLIFFTGHGTFDPACRLGYIAATDSKPKEDDENHHTWFSHAEVLRYLQAINANNCRHSLLALDVCFGGAFDESIATELVTTKGKTPYATLSLDQIYNLYFKPTQTHWFISAGQGPNPDGFEGEHSPFARALLETLKGLGNGKGYVTRADINAAIEDVVSGPTSYGYRGDGPVSTFLFIAKPDILQSLSKSK